MSMSELREAVAVANEVSRKLAEVSAQQQRLIAINEAALASNGEIIALLQNSIDQANSINDLIAKNLPTT